MPAILMKMIFMLQVKKNSMNTVKYLGNGEDTCFNMSSITAVVVALAEHTFSLHLKYSVVY